MDNHDHQSASPLPSPEEVIAKQKRESEAMNKTVEALAPLSQNARKRVLNQVLGVLSIKPVASVDEEVDKSEGIQMSPSSHELGTFGSFAEFFDCAQPTNNQQKILVGAYWVQEHRGDGKFTSGEINKELRQLGVIIKTIVRDLARLADKKPATVLQVSATGRGRGTRKTYQVTVTGKEKVEDMLGQGS